MSVHLYAVVAARSVAGLANPDALFQASIFEGAFLDTRSSVLFGVFLAIAIFILSLLRAYAPRLTIMSVFGMIAVDIYCVSVIYLCQSHARTETRLFAVGKRESARGLSSPRQGVQEASLSGARDAAIYPNLTFVQRTILLTSLR